MKLLSLALLAFAAVLASAQQTPLPDMDGIPFERFYKYPILNGRSPASPEMSPDGTKIVFGWNKTGDRKLDIWEMDFPDGKPHMIVKSDSITDMPRQDDSRDDLEKKEEKLYDGGAGGYQWSPDSKEILFSYKGRVWTMGPDGSNLQPLIDANAGIYQPQYSPDGKYLGYLQGGNLYRMDRQTGRIRQLTFVSKPNTSVDGYEWSPDGKEIEVSWGDSSKTGHGVMMDFSKDRATVVNISRDWNGDLSNDSQIGVIPADGGIIKFVPDLPHNLWIKDIEWSPDSKSLAVAWIKDDFQEFTISLVDPGKVKKSDVYHEKAPKNYIPDWRPLVWTRDSKHIVFGTDILDGKFGFRSILEMDPDGKNLKKLFAQNYDCASLMRPKDSDRLILTTLSRSPLSTEVTVLEPDGRVTQHVVMPDGVSVPSGFDDTSSPLVSWDGTKMATLASNRKINPELYEVEPAMKRLTYSQPPEFSKIKWADFKEITFPAKDGMIIHGLLITKPGLDLTKKHPAFVSNIYANSAKDQWGGYMENYAAMRLDMVVLLVDFRASWGYGGEFSSGYANRMGLIDSDEAASAHEYLASLPYVNKDRIGIWGWSYGGFLTLMTMLTKPGVYDTGVAVAAVSDWKSYNEWYTRRRLGLAKDDKDKVFEKTSPITYAAGLQGNLMMIHGMLDDNVLFQDDARMVQQFIDHDKFVDLRYYPRDDHGIGKDTSRPHVFATIMKYLWEKLSRP
ncbi:MAG TPA: prolyl oligopeptidase family serine peptidase [Fimbriimonadaceae bacterium]|nr:prolyl oligopeptidase family serine peptidase [Fimbriimonadaceae bacterium]